MMMSNIIKLPRCEICGREIMADYCYAGWGFDRIFVCVPCMEKAKASLPNPIANLLDEAADEYWTHTPVMEDGVWI